MQARSSESHHRGAWIGVNGFGKWNVRCACGWESTGHEDADEANDALAQHVDEANADPAR